MSVARWLPSSPAHGKTKSRRSSSAVRPTLLVIAVTVIAVLLVAVVFGGAGRWTLSGGGDTSWVSAGARVVINAGKYAFPFILSSLTATNIWLISCS
jgi:hypothetical protein